MVGPWRGVLLLEPQPATAIASSTSGMVRMSAFILFPSKTIKCASARTPAETRARLDVGLNPSSLAGLAGFYPEGATFLVNIAARFRLHCRKNSGAYPKATMLATTPLQWDLCDPGAD